MRLAVAALLVGLIVGACGYDSRGDTADSIPCEEPAQYVNLGRPTADGESRTAEITVDAEGEVWASLSGPIPPGGFIPQIDVAGLYFGRSSLPPTNDPGSSTIGNTLDGNPDDDILTSVHLHYQGFAEIPFPDNDRYWIVLTQRGDLELFTCQPNILGEAVKPTGGWTGEDFVYSQTRAEIITRVPTAQTVPLIFPLEERDRAEGKRDPHNLPLANVLETSWPSSVNTGANGFNALAVVTRR